MKNELIELGFTNNLLADDGCTFMEITVNGLEVSCDFSDNEFDVCINKDKSDLIPLPGCKSLDQLKSLLSGLGYDKVDQRHSITVEQISEAADDFIKPMRHKLHLGEETGFKCDIINFAYYLLYQRDSAISTS